MRIFQGCVEGREIAMTRKGMNSLNAKPLTTVLVTKAAPAPKKAPKADDPPEKNEMTPAEIAKTMKTALGFDDVTKGYFVGLGEEASVAFLAKSTDDQKAEATAAKSAADAKVAEVEAAKSGKTAAEVDLQKRFDAQSAEIEILKARAVDQDVEKRAREEFSAFPGGVEKVVPLLKAFAKLPDAERTAAEGVLKAQCEIAKNAGARLGYSEDEINKAAPAHAELAAKAAELAKSEKVTVAIAKARILQDPEHAELYGRVMAEEQAAH